LITTKSSSTIAANPGSARKESSDRTADGRTANRPSDRQTAFALRFAIAMPNERADFALDRTIP